MEGDTVLSKSCDPQWERGCRNKSEALALKGGAIVGILVTGILGVTIPLLGKRVSFLRADRSFFFVAKAFAAGVVLATAFVHILPDAMATLENGCLPASPWKKFPFSGFLAMVSSLVTMVVDLISTGYFERKQQQKDTEKQQQGVTDIDVEAPGAGLTVSEQRKHVQVRLHIVGMHAHAAAHGHNHPGGEHGKHDMESHGHGHGHSTLAPTLSNMEADDEMARVRHVVVSQVLELGIITHSIVIGFSLGVSQSPCTIRPLLGALAVHQFFEGFALGGCISQAGFRVSSMVIMAVCFAVTTPLGVGIGTGVSEVYNPHSPSALIVEGIFYSLSAGILVYMALVNLIAADFLSKRMRCNKRLQVLSFVALLLGAILMSLLALWA